MRNVFTKSAIMMALVATPALAESFVLSDYEFTGLQRTTEDSVRLLLPTRGQTISDETLAAMIRTLYATEQFADVQALAQNGVVRFSVVERPIIAEVEFEGNKLIPEQGLEAGLKQAGLATGMVLKQATVHGVASELQNQYRLQGYYNSDIEIQQTSLEGNRVKLLVRFIEGKPAKVVDINIIGNKFFSDEEIKRTLLLKEKNWNLLSKSSRYGEEKLQASLAALQEMYLDAGFVRFNVDDSVVTIDEDKNRVFVELTLTEGERYTFGNTRFLGNPTYDEAVLAKEVAYSTGGQYSQSNLRLTSQQIANKFGDDGYYNAQIRPVPRINDQTRVVDIDYYIDPARPVYVRRINFSGNIKTKDEVLRREMRQLEGALASHEKIQLSRARLMRTGYFKDVQVETRPVAGTPDQMDVNFIVEEQPSGSSTLAAGYSQSGGVTFQVDLSQNNFLGTGNKVNAAFSRSETRESYSLGLTDPYFTVNGVSQGLGAYYRKTKADPKNIANYVLDAYGANLTYGYPIDERQRISGGLNIDNTDVRGGRFMGIANVKQLLADGGTARFEDVNTPDNPNDDIGLFQNDYTTYNAILGWSYSSLDKPVFPTKGMSHNVDLTLGFGDKTYQKVVYQGNYYHPFWRGTTLRGYTRLGYGNNLPFYENFYAGGYGSVRGYESSSLGPRSQAYQYLANGSQDEAGVALASGMSASRGEIVGGNALASFGAELILPLPFKGDWVEQVRPVIFVEGGQVYETSSLKNETVDLLTINPNLRLPEDRRYAKLLREDGGMRYSAGVGATWYTPIGPLSISYARPFASKEGDKTEKVQFQIGSVF